MSSSGRATATCRSQQFPPLRHPRGVADSIAHPEAQIQPRRTQTRRVVAALLILVTLPACYSWRPTTASPVTLIPLERPPQVRITDGDGERMTFENPIITNDTIVGFTPDGVRRLAPQDLTRFEVRSFSPVRTSALVVGHLAVAVGFIAVVIAIQPHYRGF